MRRRHGRVAMAVALSQYDEALKARNARLIQLEIGQ